MYLAYSSTSHDDARDWPEPALIEAIAFCKFDRPMQGTKAASLGAKSVHLHPGPHLVVAWRGRANERRRHHEHSFGQLPICSAVQRKGMSDDPWGTTKTCEPERRRVLVPRWVHVSKRRLASKQARRCSQLVQMVSLLKPAGSHSSLEQRSS